MIHPADLDRCSLNQGVALHLRKASALRRARSTMLVWPQADIQRTL
jgi:hypothetical protein